VCVVVVNFPVTDEEGYSFDMREIPVAGEG
jgi:hypothetical protein